MFLHLKWKRAHGLYYLVKLIHIFFTLLVVFYTLVYHGELRTYGPFTNCDQPPNQNTSFLDQDTETRPCSNAIFLPIIITVISFLLLMMHSTKIFQNRHSFDWTLIREYILEDDICHMKKKFLFKDKTWENQLMLSLSFSDWFTHSVTLFISYLRIPLTHLRRNTFLTWVSAAPLQQITLLSWSLIIHVSLTKH